MLNSESLTTGVLNESTFSDFVTRLAHEHSDNQSHGTAHPVFNVQHRVERWSCDNNSSSIKTKLFLNGYDETPSFDNFNELIEWLKDIDHTPLEVKQLIDHMEEYNLDSNSLDDCEVALNSIFDNEYDAEVMHCSYEWIHVSTHLTPQAANAFIERQQHNYGELRVYVSTTYFSYELKAIINGLVSGHIKYVETPCEPKVSTLAEIEQFAQCILQRADNDEHIKHYANMILAHTKNS